MKLSVIVPIYNREEYISECIDSILAQSFTDFELILVDDGSTDNSLEICKNYANRDCRIIVLSQINMGVSAARNAGLDIARGKYIGFIDSDDTIPNNFYECMIDIAENTDAELVCCPIVNDVDITDTSVDISMQIDDQETFIGKLFDIPPTIYAAVTNKMFFKSYITTYFENNVAICEDLLFVLEYCKGIRKAVIISETFYCARTHSCSITRTNPGGVVFGLDIRKRAIVSVEHLDRNIKKKAEMAFLDSCVRLSFENNTTERIPYRNIAFDELLEYIHNNPLCIILNSYIKIKQKILYYFTAIYASINIHCCRR